MKILYVFNPRDFQKPNYLQSNLYLWKRNQTQSNDLQKQYQNLPFTSAIYCHTTLPTLLYKPRLWTYYSTCTVNKSRVYNRERWEDRSHIYGERCHSCGCQQLDWDCLCACQIRVADWVSDLVERCGVSINLWEADNIL